LQEKEENQIVVQIFHFSFILKYNEPVKS